MFYLFSFIVGIVLTILEFKVFPSTSFNLVSNEENKHSSSIRYLLSSKIFYPIMFACIPTIIHVCSLYAFAFIQGIIINKVNYSLVERIKPNILEYYLLISFGIFITITQLYYARFFIPIIPSDKYPVYLNNNVVIEHGGKRNVYQIRYTDSNGKNQIIEWVERQDKIMEHPELDGDARVAVFALRQYLNIPLI